MFNKENKKTDFVNDSLKSVKFHTMKDDLTHRVEETNFKKEPEIKESNQAKENSPFMNSSYGSVGVEAVSVKRDTNDNSYPVSPTPQPTPVSSPVHTYPTFNSDIPFSPKNDSAPQNNTKTEDSLTFEIEEKSSAFMYIVILILILLLGAGGYYFWMVKEGKIEETGIIQDILDYKEDVSGGSSSGVNEKVGGNIPVTDLSNGNAGFSDKTNFLVIAKGELTPTGIKSAIDKKFLEMDKYAGNQLEFLVVDKDNKPFTFRDFVTGSKMVLDTTITGNLEMENFSLFLYKKNNVKRVSLVLSVKNKNLLKANLLSNEKNLLNGLAPLFIYEKPTDASNVQFKESAYKDSLIRYVNLNKNMDLSLDYAISGDYLILATNKESGRLIIDKLSEEMVGNGNVFTP